MMKQHQQKQQLERQLIPEQRYHHHHHQHHYHQQQQQQRRQSTPRRPALRRISERSWQYMVGVWGLLVASLLFAVAVFSPAWHGKEGLWVTCSQGPCRLNLIDQHWLHAVRFWSVLALSKFITCIILEVHLDFRKACPPRPDTNRVEILGGAASAVGLVVAFTFSTVVRIQRPKERWSYYLLDEQQSSTTPPAPPASLSWGFWLAACSSLLGLFSSLLLMGSRAAQARQEAARLGVCPVPAQTPAPAAAVLLSPPLPGRVPGPPPPAAAVYPRTVVLSTGSAPVSVMLPTPSAAAAPAAQNLLDY